MKRILTFITIISLFTACTTEEVVEVQNNFIAAQSFERTVDLVAPNYEQTFSIPTNIELFETDMVLAYHLVGVDADGFDIWRLLPDTVFTSTGEQFQYNFEHSFDLITLFIDAPSTFDFNSLLQGDTLDQTFRIVILPVDFINSNNIDATNFSEVMSYVK
ncbi:dihydrolipoamide dehydrogenase [Winogradskyella maritima]|uniref:Dihydrolipoamide dehydrogenase n=1 Tax=Winogradskyella maritima TaxID=1517766 RepID=A0ABV8AHG4_9FLAO|nr:dihydrolipoamide dehydrogenase [Winogradskyella maritima]